MKYIVGVDLQFLRSLREQLGGDVPFRDMVDMLEQDGDHVMEVYAPAIRMPPPTPITDEGLAETYVNFLRVCTALRSQGVSVTESPAKRMGDTIKHSDDQRLMIRLAISCIKLRPDFLVLLAADGDYAPLVWALREEGIRTKLITYEPMLARDLREAVYSINDIFAMVSRMRGQGAQSQ